MTQGNDTFVLGKRAVLGFLMMRNALPESSVPDLDDGWLMVDDNGPELDERLLASPLLQRRKSVIKTVCLGAMAGV